MLSFLLLVQVFCATLTVHTLYRTTPAGFLVNTGAAIVGGTALTAENLPDNNECVLDI